jgi:hypothetical protein
MHISLGIPILQGSGVLGAYFTRDPYTPGVLGALGMHISPGTPILPVFWAIDFVNFNKIQTVTFRLVLTVTRVIFLLTQRLQDQLSNPHYLKPSAAASSRASGGGRAGESTGLTESSGLTAIDTSKIPVQKLELGIGLIIGGSLYTHNSMIWSCDFLAIHDIVCT